MEKGVSKNVISILSIIFCLIVALVIPTRIYANTQTLWKYQCVDTMKTSRDKARQWRYRSDLKEHIEKELSAIKGMGGNCVAIDTPYDDEFMPYLTAWVEIAREKNLFVWFRGNLSSWEGWFEYPKGMTTDELLKKMENFILKHRDLFRDGDIFTPAPEGENGGPFNQVETEEHAKFRQFLVDEHYTAQKTFKKIGKKVETNWLSMNGGLAKRMLNQKTINELEQTVAIDHYIDSAQKMGEFIGYFKDKFGAKVVIGEFGAPIPEINGVMTESQQAQFIDELSKEIYKHKDDVVGVNYWTLYDGSTALVNYDFSPREAVEIIKNYYIPGVVNGTVSNTVGDWLINIPVKTGDGLNHTTTDRLGRYSMVIPASMVEITIGGNKYKAVSRELVINRGGEITNDVIIEPVNIGFIYRIRLVIQNLKKQLLTFLR